MYQGREMTVIEGVGDEGELKMADYNSGIFAIAEMLKINTSLTDLKYASLSFESQSPMKAPETEERTD